MTDAITPELRNLIAHTDEAYEATFPVVNSKGFDSRPEAEMVYNAQALLNLIKHTLENPTPDDPDLSADFGDMTLDALAYFTKRVETETFTMLTARQIDVNNAVKIGEELSHIEEALRQGKIVFSNQAEQINNTSNLDWWDSAIFNELSRRREELRQELLQNFGPV